MKQLLLIWLFTIIPSLYAMAQDEDIELYPGLGAKIHITKLDDIIQCTEHTIQVDNTPPQIINLSKVSHLPHLPHAMKLKYCTTIQYL